MEKSEVITLEDRGFIQVNGSEAKDFLQNIVTSDIEKVSSNSTLFSSILLLKKTYRKNTISLLIKAIDVIDRTENIGINERK